MVNDEKPKSGAEKQASNDYLKSLWEKKNAEEEARAKADARRLEEKLKLGKKDK